MALFDAGWCWSRVTARTHKARRRLIFSRWDLADEASAGSPTLRPLAAQLRVELRREPL
jgi:hypothetical protein